MKLYIYVFNYTFQRQTFRNPGALCDVTRLIRKDKNTHTHRNRSRKVLRTKHRKKYDKCTLAPAPTL